MLEVIPLLRDLVNLFPSEQKRLEMSTKLNDLEAQIAQGQLEVNKVEAANANLFVSGWRPFVGWVCGLGLAYSVIGPAFSLPVANLETLLTVLFGMLGLGGLRTFEKVKGLGK